MIAHNSKRNLSLFFPDPLSHCFLEKNRLRKILRAQRPETSLTSNHLIEHALYDAPLEPPLSSVQFRTPQRTLVVLSSSAMCTSPRKGCASPPFLHETRQSNRITRATKQKQTHHRTTQHHMTTVHHVDAGRFPDTIRLTSLMFSHSVSVPTKPYRTFR